MCRIPILSKDVNCPVLQTGQLQRLYGGVRPLPYLPGGQAVILEMCIRDSSDCDLFVYVGGESDGWVENALKNAANRNMKVINLLERCV